MNKRDNKLLKPTIKVVLGNGLHRFVSLSQLSSREGSYNWQCKGLPMCFVIREARLLIAAHSIIIYAHSCNTHSGLVILKTN